MKLSPLKIKLLVYRQGTICWLCRDEKRPLIFDDRMSRDYRTADHIVPRKWGGSNGLHNIMLAHHRCNSNRDNLYPETLIFTEAQILSHTYPNTETGGPSKAAMRGIRAMRRLAEKNHDPRPASSIT